ncbi:MAG: hypothetical protein II439_06140, partial [Firmicutes bacterium]|nr:hypothetical protein [Bacillota bacterium]
STTGEIIIKVVNTSKTAQSISVNLLDMKGERTAETLTLQHIGSMDDENTFATHMDAYGSVSNLMYMKDYGPYMVTLVAIKKENYDAAYAIMEEIDAYINEL